MLAAPAQQLMINAKDTDEENRPIDGTRFPEAATAEMDSIANVLLQLTQLNLAGSNNVLARSVQNWSKIANIGRIWTKFGRNPIELDVPEPLAGTPEPDSDQNGPKNQKYKKIKNMPKNYCKS